MRQSAKMKRRGESREQTQFEKMKAAFKRKSCPLLVVDDGGQVRAVGMNP